MGKQINYYMGYEDFLQVAQTALDAGCLILRGGHTDESVQPSSELSVVTRECNLYYFYLPELAELQYGVDCDGKYYLKYGFTDLCLAMVEAGFSRHPAERARIFVMTGRYDKNGEWNPRPERLTKVYDKLARKVRRILQQSDHSGRR